MIGNQLVRKKWSFKPIKFEKKCNIYDHYNIYHMNNNNNNNNSNDNNKNDNINNDNNKNDNNSFNKNKTITSKYGVAKMMMMIFCDFYRLHKA